MSDFDKILEHEISTDIITYQNDNDSIYNKLHELKKSKAIQMKSSTIFLLLLFISFAFIAIQHMKTIISFCVIVITSIGF